MSLEQEQIASQFQALLEMEKQAEALYAQLLDKVEDATVRQKLEQLRKDKQRHIRLTQRLLEIVD